MSPSAPPPLQKAVWTRDALPRVSLSHGTALVAAQPPGPRGLASASIRCRGLAVPPSLTNARASRTAGTRFVGAGAGDGDTGGCGDCGGWEDACPTSEGQLRVETGARIFKSSHLKEAKYPDFHVKSLNMTH